MSIEVCDKTTVSQRAGLCRGSSWAFWSIFSWSFGSSQYKKDPCQRIWSWHEQKECKSPLNGFAIAHECMHQDEVQSALWYREVINFLQVHPLPKQKVKHTSSQQIPNIKIKTQLLYLLNTFMWIFYTLMIVNEMSSMLNGQADLVPGSKTCAPSRFFEG